MVLAQEDFSNQVKKRAISTKTRQGVCRFFGEDVIYCYDCVGKITHDTRKLNAKVTWEFFKRMRIKFILTMAYN